jgi:hypothetical protein
LLKKIHKAAASSAVQQTTAAFDQRRGDPNWFDPYRIVQQPVMDRSTVIDQVRSLLLVLATAY